MLKGLLGALRGVGDQFDFVPGFDPDKEKQGLISQLIGANGPKPQGSAYQPELNSFLDNDSSTFDAAKMAPGGAMPQMQPPQPMDYTTRLNVLDVLNPFKDARGIRANDQARYNFAKDQFTAQQARAASQREDAQFIQNAQAGGFTPEQIAKMQMARNANPEEFGKSFAGNFGFNTVSEGNGYSRFGGDMVKNEKTFTPTDPAKLALDERGLDIRQQSANADTLTAQARNRDSLTNEWEARNGPVDDGPDVSGESALRKEFFGQNKGFQEVQRSYDRIVSTDPTNAAGQMSLIFQYMKMMDPGSTVREGEFANAQNTTGIPGQVLNAYNRAARGEYLNPNQVTEFQNQAEALYTAAADEFERSFKTYRATASEYQFSPERTIPDLRNPAYGSPMGGPEIAQISSDGEYDALPSGAEYLGPDGVRRIKP